MNFIIILFESTVKYCKHLKIMIIVVVSSEH